jgi:hypothetical protein
MREHREHEAVVAHLVILPRDSEHNQFHCRTRRTSLFHCTTRRTMVRLRAKSRRKVGPLYLQPGTTTRRTNPVRSCPGNMAGRACGPSLWDGQPSVCET